MTFYPLPASNFAPHIDWLFRTMLIVSTLLTAAVWGLMIWFCVKYRESATAERTPPQPSSRPELALTTIMFLIGVTAFLWGARFFYHMYTPPKDALEINVVAKQWMWVFHDPRHGDRINVLRVPRGRPVRLLMTSSDVIHSLFIPGFRVKQDVLPGRYTSLWFTAERLGRFTLLCTQYCGLEHSQMRAVVEVVEPDVYDRDPRPANDDRQVFTAKGCASCHDGARAIGPSLRGLYRHQVHLADGRTVNADENYLRRAIEFPEEEITAGFPPTMPSYRGQLSEGELRALIGFIKSEAER